MVFLSWTRKIEPILSQYKRRRKGNDEKVCLTTFPRAEMKDPPGLPFWPFLKQFARTWPELEPGPGNPETPFEYLSLYFLGCVCLFVRI